MPLKALKGSFKDSYIGTLLVTSSDPVRNHPSRKPSSSTPCLAQLSFQLQRLLRFRAWQGFVITGLRVRRVAMIGSILLRFREGFGESSVSRRGRVSVRNTELMFPEEL